MMHGAAIDSKRFRSVMGSFPTGVAGHRDRVRWGAVRRYDQLTDIRVARALHAPFCTNEASATGAAIRKRGLFSVGAIQVEGTA